MSHFTTIQTQIKDIAALQAAVKELGLGLHENARARGWGDNTRHGEYVIKLKGPYDVALNRNQDGSFGLSTDWYQGHVEKEVGAKYGKLLQLYGVHKTMIEARKKGHLVQRKQQPNGAIKLEIGGV